MAEANALGEKVGIIPYISLSVCGFTDYNFEYTKNGNVTVNHIYMTGLVSDPTMKMMVNISGRLIQVLAF